jgi:hypothetical protein
MITTEESTQAVHAFRICRYFPAEEFQRAQIVTMLIEMVTTKAELDWLVHEQCKLDWKGPYELRQLFSTRFAPRDSIADMDPERAYFERESAETDRKIAEWKREQKLLGEAPVVIDVTPAIRRIGAIEVKPTVNRTADDLRFERMQQLLGKETQPVHIPGTPERTPEEREKLIHEMEHALGIEEAPKRFGYCAAFEQIPGADFKFRPNLPFVLPDVA